MTNLLHKKVTICMIFIGLTMLGYISYKQLPVELLPNAELPMLFVQIGAATSVSPQYMEQQGVIPVEGAIGTLEGVEEINTRINGNQAFIQVSFEQDVRFKYVFLKLQQKIDAVKRQLPADIFVNVAKIDLQQLTNQFLELQIRGSGGTDRLRNVSEKEIRPAFENLSGVASINVFGGREKNLEILLDKQAAEPHNITPETVRSRLTQNSGSRTLAGFVYEGDYRYFIRTASEYADVKEIENIVMAPGPILLKDVAQISFGVDEETSISRVNGKDAISMTITKASQSNIIDLSHQCLDLIDQLNEQLRAKDVEIVVQQNLAERMEENIQQIIDLGLIGGLLAVFVLWIFLKDLRLISVIAVSIPISVFAAFNLFYGAGISINSLTLVGMALAVGMLLDNSIVVLENIYRLVSGGTPREKAVTRGVSGVIKAILASTLTTATVFLPFLFFGNYLVALIGKHIGVSIISTLFVSLLVALLLIPVLAYIVLSLYSDQKMVSFGQSKVRTRIERLYLVLLKSSLRNPARTVIGGLLLFFITTFAVLAVSINANEEVETDQMDVFVTMPKGATIEATDKIVQEIEAKMETIAEKKDYTSRIREEDAVVSLILQEDFAEIEDRSFYEIKEHLERLTAQIGGATISLTQQNSEGGGGVGGMDDLGQLMGFGDNREKIILKGEDFPLLQRVAQDLMYYIQNLDGTRNISLSTGGDRPEVQLVFDPLTLARNEITPENIAVALRDFGQEAPADTRFQYADEEYNIIIRESEDQEMDYQPKTLSELRKLEVTDQSGGKHELASFSTIRTASDFDEIRRVNQQKQIEITYGHSREAEQSKELLDAHKESIQALIAGYPVPPGIAIEMVAAEDQLKDFKALAGAAMLLIFIILASVFESLSAPFVLLFSVPMAITGALLALFITGNSLFNANTLTGFLILLGVIVNNGIILIDYVNALRRSGFRKSRALMTAGLHRLRPILITAITTIVAMFPLALGTAEYVSLIGAPFAITVIGGLALGTLLTLVVIPTVYLGLESSISWFRNLPWWIRMINIAILAAGFLLVYFRVDSLLWQMADFLLLFFLVPAITYFILTSLRSAQAELIPENESLHITVQNLVKIYGRPGRFAREWSGSKALADHHRSASGTIPWGRLVQEFIWQVPLLVFLFWYTFSYLRGGFWATMLAVGFYFLLLDVWRPVGESLRTADQRWKRRIGRLIGGVLLWLTPLLLIAFLSRHWTGGALPLLVGTVWYLALIIYRSSLYVQEKQLKIERIKSSIRRFYFRLISNIPVLGKRTVPFKALSGVSLEIGTGMYGLLGPNGAGKSTLMRIISGIFDQSYGKIWINGIDTQEKREELQALIGYLPQAFGSYENMSAWNYLDYQAILKGLNNNEVRKERLEYVLGAVNMLDRKDEKIGSFSGGMKQRIGIAQILLHLPRILVVDEPTAGLDPRERIRFRNLLVQLSRERIVIFSTHIIEDIASSCNQLAVINKGAVKYQGSPQDMLHLAEGLVWEYLIPAKELDQIDPERVVVNTLREGDQVRVRCISREQPVENAVPVEPVLEDAYLCLLKNMEK
jgi:multidrug efflux pump subunit AcrB/ABC-type multidrug transport system ATPase subunit